MEQPSITKKRIFGGVSLLLVFCFLIFAGTHAYLRIEAPPGTKIVGTIKNASGLVVKSLDAGQKKGLLLSPGSYFAEFSSGNKITGYQISAHRFLIPTTIKLKFQNQKDAIALGQSTRGCISDVASSSISVYYECQRQSTNLPAIFDGTNQKTLFGNEANITATNPLITSTAPYMGNLITISGKQNVPSVAFNQISLVSGAATQVAQSQLPNNFGFNTFDLQTDTVNPNNPLFALYNNPSDKFLVFDKMGSSYRSMDIPERKKVPQYTVKFRVVNSKIYVLRGLSVDTAAGEGGEKPFNDFSDPQQYSVIDTFSGRTETSIKLSNSFRIENLFVNSKGQALVLGRYKNDSDSSLFLVQAKKLVKLPTLGTLRDGLAWASDNEFYYLSGVEMFKYSINDKVSYLVYKNDQASVSSLTNQFGSVYLSVSPSDSSNLVYLRLTEKDLGLGRPETVLPIYNDIAHSILSVNIYKDGLYIQALKGKSESEILAYLKTFGLDPRSYVIYFNQ
jgi:hypothetical protein